MKTEKYQGFTLIELMIVIAILGVLAAIAIPAYNGYISSGHETECQNEVSSIKLAESEYFLEQNTYFSGNDVGDLYKNSGHIYTPSTTANTSSQSQCVYKATITSSPPSYTITADPNTAYGKLPSVTGHVVQIQGP